MVRLCKTQVRVFEFTCISYASEKSKHTASEKSKASSAASSEDISMKRSAASSEYAFVLVYAVCVYEYVFVCLGNPTHLLGWANYTSNASGLPRGLTDNSPRYPITNHDQVISAFFSPGGSSLVAAAVR